MLQGLRERISGRNAAERDESPCLQLSTCIAQVGGWEGPGEELGGSPDAGTSFHSLSASQSPRSQEEQLQELGAFI